MSRSWVMTTMVMPRSARSCAKISITSWLVVRVEVAGRLVGQQQRRLGDQRAGDRDALLLAARQLVGMVLRRDRSRPTAASARRGPVAPLRCLDDALARVEQRQLDVLERRGARQQVEALEHEADGLVADARQFVVRQRRDVAAVEQVTPGGRPIETAEDVHERRLAGARRSDDRDELAGGDVQRDAPAGRAPRGRRRRSVFVEIVNANHCWPARSSCVLVAGLAGAAGSCRRTCRSLWPPPSRRRPCRRPCRRLRSRSTRWPRARGRRARRRPSTIGMPLNRRIFSPTSPLPNM